MLDNLIENFNVNFVLLHVSLDHKTAKYLAYLGNISVALYVEEINAECRVISKGNQLSVTPRVANWHVCMN